MTHIWKYYDYPVFDSVVMMHSSPLNQECNSVLIKNVPPLSDLLSFELFLFFSTRMTTFSSTSSHKSQCPHIWPFAPFNKRYCRHKVCCSTALITKLGLQGRHTIPVLGIYLHARGTTKAENIMYSESTFQGGDPRLGVSHSPAFTKTTQKQIDVARKHTFGWNLIQWDGNIKTSPVPLVVCNFSSATMKASIHWDFMQSSFGAYYLWEKMSHFIKNRKMVFVSLSLTNKCKSSTRPKRWYFKGKTHTRELLTNSPKGTHTNTPLCDTGLTAGQVNGGKTCAGAWWWAAVLASTKPR